MDPKIVDQLHDAADGNNVRKLKKILDNTPDAVDWPDENDEAALVTPACNSCLDALKFLLDRGADPCRQKGFALTCACYWGHVEAARILLEAGADRVIRESRRWHGLHTACGWGRHPKLEIVKLLIEYGANASRVFEGKTPLQYAQSKNEDKIVEFLTRHLKEIRNKRE